MLEATILFASYCLLHIVCLILFYRYLYFTACNIVSRSNPAQL